MEDTYLAQCFDLEIGNQKYPVHVFGVFDGHNGEKVALFVQKTLVTYLADALSEFNPQKLSHQGIWNALKIGCVDINEEFFHQGRAHDQGSTATIALIFNDELWVANVGDSRTILDNGGTPVQLSEDAKPEAVRYRKTISHRGGDVLWFHSFRINKILAVARAFGDFEINGISARPKNTCISMQGIQRGTLILASDGFFDVTSTKQAAQAVHEHPEEPIKALAANLVYSAWKADSKDNITVLVIRLD
jgi:protein phosphatase 1L